MAAAQTLSWKRFCQPARESPDRFALMLQVSGLQGRALSGLQMRRQRSWQGSMRTRA